jgi:hypothetical protein
MNIIKHDDNVKYIEFNLFNYVHKIGKFDKLKTCRYKLFGIFFRKNNSNKVFQIRIYKIAYGNKKI